MKSGRKRLVSITVVLCWLYSVDYATAQTVSLSTASKSSWYGEDEYCSFVRGVADSRRALLNWPSTFANAGFVDSLVSAYNPMPSPPRVRLMVV